jgi:NADP-dependent 3-hydroxy acid dehydrogenase YdfG
MRAAGDGVIVLVSSYAGWAHSPNAGVAYAASKTALSVVSSSLNAQEGAAGIRSCHLCPGDTATDFLRLRPRVPDLDQQRTMLTAEDVARSVQFVLDSPPHVTIDELVITPTSLTR